LTQAFQNSTTWVRTFHPPEEGAEAGPSTEPREKFVASYLDGG